MAAFKSNNILRSLKIVWQSSPLWSLFNALVVISKGVMPLLLIFVVQMLVDEVSGVLQAKETTRDVVNVYRAIFFAAGVFFFNAVLNSLADLIREKHSFYIIDAVQHMIHKRTTTLDFINFDNFNFQNSYYRAVNEAHYRPTSIYYGFVGLIQNSITLVLIAGLLASLHWFMLLLLLLISVPVIYIRLKFSRKIYSFKREHTEDERYVNYHNRLLTGKEFAKELRVFNLAALFKTRFEKQKNELRTKRFALMKVKTGYEFLVQLITALALIVVFGFIAAKAINGELTQGQMVMYFLAMYRGYGFLQDFLGRVSALYENGLFLKNLFEFIDFDMVKHSARQTESFPVSLREGIAIKNLSFKYPNSTRNVFENLTLKIQAGETIALVGANGAGKSTLVKLLCGLYQPDKGIITIDGINLYAISKRSLAENVSVVFQDFMLYNVSAKENIWFGNVNRSPEDKEIYASAKKSGVHHLIEDLPKGFETTLGTLFKDSEMLSVGEWQRMALARSFFNEAQLVILDEPTSSLDAFTEAKLIENFKVITKNRTAIIVSHRMSTIHLADRVVVLNNHGVAEEGSPQELLKQKGVFYDMVESLKRK